MTLAKCNLCKGKRKFNAGNGVWIPCPGCTSGRAAATIADAIAARPATDGTPTELRFVVDGDPIGKERARVFSKTMPSGKTITRAVTPEKTREYEERVRACAQAAVLATKWAWHRQDVFTIILRIFRKHRRKGPDASNVLKAIEDACNGHTWPDDALVMEGAFVMKQDAIRPRVEIVIRRHQEVAA